MRLRCFGSDCEQSIDGHVFGTLGAAINHEHTYHDGAQTCWDVDDANERRLCPDRGTCHHRCGPTTCFRVVNCGPFSDAFDSDDWPADVIEAHPDREYVW